MSCIEKNVFIYIYILCAYIYLMNIYIPNNMIEVGLKVGDTTCYDH